MNWTIGIRHPSGANNTYCKELGRKID